MAKLTAGQKKAARASPVRLRLFLAIMRCLAYISSSWKNPVPPPSAVPSVRRLINLFGRSMCCRALIHSLPIPSGDVDIFTADASELYRHAKEPIFLFLIVSGEGVLVHDDNREVRRSARFRKVREHRFDSGDEVGFFPRKFGLVPVGHDQRTSICEGYYLVASSLFLGNDAGETHRLAIGSESV
jgi:hypothetical protein